MPMEDPVVLADDGHTYEREAIERWLSMKSTSPVTNEPIVLGLLVPNYAIESV